MLAEGLPVVLAPDDPALWGAVGASYDWTMFYFAMDERAGGLATLKQLAINSIQYSTLLPEPKAAVMKAWLSAWDDYVTWLAASTSTSASAAAAAAASASASAAAAAVPTVAIAEV